MNDDLYDDPTFRRWRRSVREDLIPKIEQSAVGVSLLPDGEPDAKFAVELGMLILYDKPIIVVVSPGVRVPPKLAKVADRIVEDRGDFAALGEAINDVVRELDEAGLIGGDAT